MLANQILRLSTHSKKEARLSDQIKSLTTLLDSFGNAKTLVNPNASRHSRYLELHFNDRGRIQGAKVLTFGLDKSRLSRLTFEERTYHIFYQFLAGATPEERDRYGLEDVSDYALLASSVVPWSPAGHRLVTSRCSSRPHGSARRLLPRGRRTEPSRDGTPSGFPGTGPVNHNNHKHHQSGRTLRFGGRARGRCGKVSP